LSHSFGSVGHGSGFVLSLTEEGRGFLVGVSGDGVADLRERERERREREMGK